MKVESLEWFANNADKIGDYFSSIANSLGTIFSPIVDMIKGFEELFFLLLGGTFILDGMKRELKNFSEQLAIWANNLNMLYAGFKGLIAGMFDVVFRAIENIGIIANNIMSGNLTNPMEGTKNLFAGYMEAGAEEFQKQISKGLAPSIDGEVDNNKVSNMIVNQDIKMTNNFKEVLQPDRIAFTIKSQLEKGARNRTSGGASGLSAQMAKGS
jgi:hypothetical protein